MTSGSHRDASARNGETRIGRPARTGNHSHPVWNLPTVLLLLVPLLFFTVDGSLAFPSDPMALRAAATAPDSHTHQLVQVIIGAIVAGYAAIHWTRVKPVLQRNFIFFLLPVLAIISTLWSDKPKSTFVNGVYLFLLTAFGCILQAILPRYRRLELVVLTGAIALTASLFLVIAMPNLGIDPFQNGAWRGIFVQRNVCSGISAVWLASALCYSGKSAASRVLRWSVVLLSLVFIVMARAVTGFELIGVIALLWLLMQVVLRFRSLERLILVATAICVCVAGIGLLIANKDTVLAMMGKDPSLDQRTEIWIVCFKTALQRPWLGFGYTAFWGGDSGTSDNVILQLGWPAAQAQNGYIDMFLSLGAAGLLLWGLSMLVTVRNLTRVTLSGKGDRFYQWTVLQLALLFVFNIGETTVIQPYNFSWLMFLLACFELEQEARTLRQHAPAEIPSHASPSTRPASLQERLQPYAS